VIKTMIVGLDGSPTAEGVLPYVETIARATGTTVTLVRVVSTRPAGEPLQEENAQLVPITVMMPLQRPHAADEAARNERYDAEHYLDGIVHRLGTHGIVSDSVVVPGEPATVLLDEARGRHADLILLATHGRSGLGRLIYGSVAEAVLAKSAVPVFLARAWKAGQGAPFGGKDAPILVALDATKEAERALPLARELASAISTGLSLIEIVPSVADETLSEGGWARDFPPDIQVREEKNAQDYLATVSAQIRAAGVPVTVSVRTDAIGAGIPAAARDSHACLIVMATHAPTGLVRVLAGSVALEVLHRVGLPMLLIGPHTT